MILTQRQVDRFWSRIDQADKNGCWLWTGARDGGGYGKMSLDGTKTLVHRISFLLHFGEIPENYDVCHHCDTPPCVNPSHLYSGTPQSNVVDKYARGRANHAQTIKHSDHYTGQ